ncbi:unnamed protein product [Soboliphyme baturini]|uniref:Alpha-1,3-mannosyl-glycoprotein 4-beta-N-acetylglucosaminyltransferase A n=1 Tax=Soboliphyme baturini TaxID=241478 RepID=A0A183ICG4_9BILA|nr:unnamed protein product [Soboliphyme baturini]
MKSLYRVFYRDKKLLWLPLFLFSLPAFYFLVDDSFGSRSNSQKANEISNDQLTVINDYLYRLQFLERENNDLFVELRSQIDALVNVLYVCTNSSMPGGGTNFSLVSGAGANVGAVHLNLTALGNFTRSPYLLLNALVNNGDLAVPNIYVHFAHLLRHPDSLVPAVRMSRNRRGRLVIGVPTVKRAKTTYLISTLRSLIDNLNNGEAAQVVIVVFIGEPGVTEFVLQQLKMLRDEFDEHFSSGMLEVLVPPKNYYPDFSAIRSTFNDDKQRMRWRTKQNLDYIYLMMYCQKRAPFYLQLEDDVVTRKSYFSTMFKFVHENEPIPWFMLQFSSLGFIAKFFRTSSLPKLIEFLILFYQEKPVDWLLDHFMYVRYCNPDKSAKDCKEAKSKHGLVYKPSLFQHIGVHSSLDGKVQKLKERDFSKVQYHVSHVNPPAVVNSSLTVYQKYTLSDAYAGKSFFWGLAPQNNDWIRFDLTPPVRIHSIKFRSGNPEHPDDLFNNATVEVADASVVHAAVDEEQFRNLGWFSATGSFYAVVNSPSPIRTVRIVFHSNSSNWLVLSEVWIRAADS